jgi:3-oxoacyl-[acyl-carrier-protein] synthase-3
MKTDATGLLHAGVELGNRTWDAAANELGWTHEGLDLAVMHQVSKVHTDSIAKMLRLPLEKVHVIYPEHGNVGPASVPMTLVSAAATGRLHRGARVGLMGIGSGLNCAMAEVVW